MEITQLLSEEDISLDVSVEGKRSALAEIAARIGARHGIPSETVLAALLVRERLGSTGIGHGTAIPHAFVEGLAAPAASLTRLSQPIDFDAPDGAPTDLVFTLLWPRHDSSGLLLALAGVCRPLRSPTFRKQLRLAQSAQEALTTVKQAA